MKTYEKPKLMVLSISANDALCGNCTAKTRGHNDITVLLNGLGIYDTDGNEVEYIDNKYFSDFEETGCSITVTLKYLNTDYYVFAPKDAVDWNALYKLDGNYITGVPTAADAVSINNESYTFPNEISNDIIENTRTFIQSDGFFCLFDFFAFSADEERNHRRRSSAD